MKLLLLLLILFPFIHQSKAQVPDYPEIYEEEFYENNDYQFDPSTSTYPEEYVTPERQEEAIELVPNDEYDWNYDENATDEGVYFE